MKNIVLTLIYLPIPVFIIYIFGIASYRKSSKLRLLNLALVLLFFTSIPISTKILSFPLTHFTNQYNSKNDVKAVIVLTGGIYRNIVGEWSPTKQTLQRTQLGISLAKKNQVPLIISGGQTETQAPSESRIIKTFLNIENCILDEVSKNTYETSINLRKIIPTDSNYPILVITDKYHALRSYLTA